MNYNMQPMKQALLFVEDYDIIKAREKQTSITQQQALYKHWNHKATNFQYLHEPKR